MEMLWEEEGFQFGFKRWKGWAVSKVLWQWIPNVGAKAREGAEAMSLALVLLDFQHAHHKQMHISKLHKTSPYTNIKQYILYTQTSNPFLKWRPDLHNRQHSSVFKDLSASQPQCGSFRMVFKEPQC